MLQFDEKYLKQAQRVNAGFMIKRLQEGFYQNKSLDPDRIAEDVLVLYLSEKWRVKDHTGSGLKRKTFDSFKAFVEHVPPYGLGVYWAKLKRICTDTVAAPIFLTEVPEANPVGRPSKEENKKEEEGKDKTSKEKIENIPVYKVLPYLRMGEGYRASLYKLVAVDGNNIYYKKVGNKKASGTSFTLNITPLETSTVLTCCSCFGASRRCSVWLTLCATALVTLGSLDIFPPVRKK